MNPTMTLPAMTTTPRASEHASSATARRPSAESLTTRARQWLFAFDSWRGADRAREFVLI